jgi:tetratricopeptide (TPR) repeat protein
MRERIWLLACLLTVGPVAGAEPGSSDDAPPPEPGVMAWLEGDAGRAADELSGRTDRDGALNHAVALLYAGHASAAESELLALRAREPGFFPALRWLARAQAATGSPDRETTIEELLSHPEAGSRDFLRVGRLDLEAGRAERAAAELAAAVAREPELYLGWLWLGDAEERRGRWCEARTAWGRARDLHAGGDVLLRLGRACLREGRAEEARALLSDALDTREGRGLEDRIRRLSPDLPPRAPEASYAPVTRPGERLRYSARYLFFGFATLEIENRGYVEVRGRRAMRVVLSVRSKPGFPFLKIDSRFETYLGEDGSVLAHRNVSRDSTAVDHASAYDMDPATGECTARGIVGGLFDYDRLPLPPFAQDGVSVLLLARALARAPGALSVLTAVDGTWKGTTLSSGRTSRLGRQGRDIEVLQVDADGRYRGPAGQSGRIRSWCSRDERAVPYKAAIKVALGSVVLTLREDSPGIEP